MQKSVQRFQTMQVQLVQPLELLYYSGNSASPKGRFKANHNSVTGGRLPGIYSIDDRGNIAFKHAFLSNILNFSLWKPWTFGMYMYTWLCKYLFSCQSSWCIATRPSLQSQSHGPAECTPPLMNRLLITMQNVGTATLWCVSQRREDALGAEKYLSVRKRRNVVLKFSEETIKM